MSRAVQAAPELTEGLELPLLGVPVRYSSNSPAVIAAASRALGRWRELPSGLIDAGTPAGVKIVVQPTGPGEPAGLSGPVVARAHGDTFLAAGGGCLMTARPAEGSALAFVTPELVADEPRLRRAVIERLGFVLVGHRDRAPISAAGVVRNGRAVLLLGSDDAGATVLCYACVRAGFALLAEDTVWVGLAGGLRVWGHAGSLALPPAARRLFPELARAGDGPGLVVDLTDAGQVATHAERAVVCFVERAVGQASRVELVGAAEAAGRIVAARPELDVMGGGASAAATALAAGGVYRLTLGSDPGSAVLLLELLAERHG